MFVLLSAVATGQVQVRVSPDFNDTLLCVGGNFIVPYFVDSDTFYAETNNFKAQLSDAAGNFSGTSPVIGTAGGFDDGQIQCTLPVSLPPGTGYRIRILSTQPAQVSAPNNKNLRISPIPKVEASNNTPICPSGVLQLTGNSDAPSTAIYTWTGPGNFTSGQASPSYSQPALSYSGIYTLSVTAYKCTGYDTTKVIIVDPPDPWIRPAGPINACNGGSFTIDAQDTSRTPGLQFSWTGPAGLKENYGVFYRYNVNPTFDGFYVIKLQVGNCVKWDSVKVNILPSPDSPVATSNTPVCLGDTLRLYADCASHSVTYLWEGPNGFFAESQYPKVPNVTFNAAGEYKVRAKFISNGCKSVETKTKVVIGSPLPEPSIKGNVPLCAGGIIKLTAIGGTTNLGQYTWTLPNAQTALGNIFNKLNITKADTGIYTVVQSYEGCKSPPAQVYVLIREVPVPTAASNSPVCDGEALNFTAPEIDSATYEWTGPDNFTATGRAPSIAAAGLQKSGDYAVTASIANCTASSSVKAIVNPIPRVTEIAGETSVCDGDSMRLEAKTDVANCNFLWTGPNGFTAAFSTLNFVAGEEIEGSYSVAASANNCISQPLSTDIKVHELPAIPVISTNSPVKEGEELQLHATCATPDVAFTWTGINGYKAAGESISIKDITTESEGIYYVMATNKEGCSSLGLSIVKILPDNQSKYQLYPNPGNGIINLKAYIPTQNHATIQIFNALGQQVYQEKILPVNRRLSTTIDLRNVMGGVYMMRIRTDKETKEVSFVVQ